MPPRHPPALQAKGVVPDLFFFFFFFFFGSSNVKLHQICTNKKSKREEESKKHNFRKTQTKGPSKKKNHVSPFHHFISLGPIRAHSLRTLRSPAPVVPAVPAHRPWNDPAHLEYRIGRGGLVLRGVLRRFF